MMEVLALEYIVRDPKIRGGRPVVAGTGIRVMDIAALTKYHHRSPAEITESYGLTMAQVHAALAYYYDHQAEIDTQLEADDAAVLKAKEQAGDSSLLNQIGARIPNLHPNAMTMSEDFDEPLPLSFWLGDDSE
jgi:uncharacterized protein (DUF433 family)